jgi:aspartate aminotransferase-like enzyme
VKALGLTLFSPDDASSAMVTAFQMPDGVDGQQVYARLRDRFGIVLAGGQGPLRGRIVRIGHMGYMNEFDIITALSGLELALRGFGYRPAAAGAGAARALEIFAEEGGG